MPEPGGTWMYAVAPAMPPDLAGLRGVAGEAVRGLACGALTAVVGTVDLDRFGEAALHRALTVPAQVEHLARAHHGVVDAVARVAPTVPFRLATVFLGDDRVRAFVAGRRNELDAALRRTTGRAEWGVKAFLAASAPAADAAAKPGEAAGRDARAGTTYLLRRREQLTRRDRVRAAALAQAEHAYVTLCALAADAVHHPITTSDQHMLLNAAFLIDHGSAAAFAGTVRALSRATDVRLELTGPWAPYSFVRLDGGPDDTAGTAPQPTTRPAQAG